MKCTQDPSRASLQFIWTLYYQIIVIAGGREGGRFFFVTNLWWDFMFSFVWESCNYLWFSCTPPKKVIQVEIPELKNFFAKFISNGKWAAATSQMSQLLEAISGTLFAFQMKNMLPYILFIILCVSLLYCIHL